VVLKQKVIFTKDNLSKRNWHGCKKCAFCDHEESINHLFFDCPFARLVWRVVHFTFNIVPPTNCTNMFNLVIGLMGLTKIQRHKFELELVLLYGLYGIAEMI
jgi:hypothetical protein